MIVPRNDLSQSTAAAAAIRELETAIERGESQCSEKILQQFPAVYSDEESLLELLYTEFVIRSESGTQADSVLIGEFQARFPHLNQKLDELFRVGKVLSPLFSSDANSTQRNGVSNSRRLNRVANSAPENLGDYEIIDVLGQGGMGIVYKAVQVSLDRVVAIKTVDEIRVGDRRIAEQLIKEAELASQLQHPNIVQIFEVGGHDEIPFFSMEYIEGGTLADAIRHRPLSPRMTAMLVATIARAVGYAHEKKVLHRDLKPSNILLAASDRPEALAIRVHGFEDEPTPRRLGYQEVKRRERFEPKVADFGLAIGLEDKEADSRALGTPSYMAPEQIDARFGTVGVPSDIYSLGAILYHCLSGRPPFQAPTLKETLDQVRNDEAQPLSTAAKGVPKDLAIICSKCLNKDPKDRYATAIELADDLQRFLTDNPIRAKAPNLVEHAIKWSRRHPSQATLILVFAIAACVATVLWRTAAKQAGIEMLARQRAERIIYGNKIALANIEIRSHDLVRCRQILSECEPKFRDWEWTYLNAIASEAIWESPPVVMYPSSTAISADGRWVVGGWGIWGKDNPQTIDVWDADTNKKVWSFEGHPSSDVGSVRFHPDGSKLLSAAVVSFGKEQGGVFEWDLMTGKLHRKVADVNARVAAYTPDGKHIVVGTMKGKVQIYDAVTGVLLRTFSEHLLNILSIDFGSGDRFVSTSRDGIVCLWNLQTGLLDKLNDMGDPRQVVWLNDSENVWIQGYSGLVSEFELKENKFRFRHSDQGRNFSFIALSPDSMLYAKAGFGEGIELRMIHNDQLIRELHGHRGNVRTIAFSADGKRVVTGGTDGVLRVWDLRRSPTPPTKTMSGGGAVEDFVCHPQKPELALAIRKSDFRGATSAGEPRLEIRDANTMQLLRSVNCHNDWLTRVAYSPSGNRVVTGSLDHTLCVWDSETLEKLHQFDRHQKPIVSASFIDEETVISMDEDGVMYVWHGTDGAIRFTQRFERRSPQSSTVDSSKPAGRILADSALRSNHLLVVFTGKESEVQLWDWRRKTMVRQWTIPFNVHCIAQTDEGQLLAAAGEQGQCLVYDVKHIESNRPLMPITISIGNASHINSLTFSPNGMRLCSAGEDETIRLFDAKVGTQLLNFHGPYSYYSTIQFTSDGESLIRFTNRTYETWSVRSEARTPNEKWAIQMAEVALAARNRSALRFYCNKAIHIGNDAEKARELVLRDALSQTHVSVTETESAYQDLIEHHPETSSGYALMHLMRADRLDDAKAFLRRAESKPQLSDNDPIFVNSIAWYAALMDADRESLEFWGKRLHAAHRTRKQSYYANTLSLLEYRLGNIDASLKLVEESLKLDRTMAAPLDWMIQLSCLLVKAQKLDPLKQKKEMDAIKKKVQSALSSLDSWSKSRASRLDSGMEDTESRFRIYHFEVPIVMAELREQVKQTNALAEMPWSILDQVEYEPVQVGVPPSGGENLPHGNLERRPKEAVLQRNRSETML